MERRCSGERIEALARLDLRKAVLHIINVLE
jgi:hypothetical protein